jgi:UDP-glucose:(heptosyl)LPS alpha-1,3-glucosyltransferase
MELAIVTDRWDVAGGGRERYLGELAGFAIRAGHSVRVFCGCAAPSSRRAASLEIDEFRGPSLASEWRMRQAVANYRHAHPQHPVLAARPIPGVTHYQLHAGLHARAFAAERESYDSRTRRLLFWPATWINPRRARLLRAERRVLSGARCPKLMVFTSELGEELMRSFGVSPERITVSPPGVDLHLFHPATPLTVRDGSGNRPPGLRLLFAGHNYALKGLRWALAAIAHTRHGGVDARLVVAGRGSTSRFRRQARRCGIETLVSFLGTVDQQALAELYRQSDALIYPTFYDPWPRVTLEALASGCPVITTRHCGTSELITPGQQGFVIDNPRNTVALAGALAALGDEDLRIRLSRAAAELGGAFDLASHAADTLRWLGLAA